jgi:iron-sulfur cluster insertion protein
MNTDATTLPPQALVFTEHAADKVKELSTRQEKTAAMLRVYIQGGGCSGFQYGFALEDQENQDDMVVETHGVKLLVDPMSFQYLMGSEIDYLEDLQGARFVINNPNATTTCGCGASFGI